PPQGSLGQAQGGCAGRACRQARRRCSGQTRGSREARARGEGGVMELKVLNDKGKSAATVAASDALFGREYNESLVHQIVAAYQANGRLGTREKKGRSDGRHSPKNPGPHKGSGRA